MHVAANCVLAELKRQLRLIYGDKLKRIILYGSYVRNDQDPNSDMDVMVLLDMSDQEIKKLHDQVLDLTVELTTRYGIVVSIIENNHDYFYEWVEVLPFFKNIDSERARGFEPPRDDSHWILSRSMAFSRDSH